MTINTNRLDAATRPRIEGALCVQRGTPMLQAFVQGSFITNQARVDVFDPGTEEGYQRAPVTSRMRAAASYYEKGGRMPNPLLLNIREDDFDAVKVVVTGGDHLAYERAIEESGDWIGTGYIEFAPDLPFWLYDGQHRKGGLEMLIARDVNFGALPVPVSLTLGLDTLAETKEFFEVNTNAKAVKTDLAWALLGRMAEDDPELQELLASTDKDWITRGIEVVHALQQMDGPWSGRILAPNARKARGGTATIPQAQFIRSLKPVLDMPVLKRAETSKIAGLINAYWLGVATVLPAPFGPRPNDYVIQKGQGAVALHRVLPQVVEVIRAKGGRLGDPAEYAEVMKELPALSGDFVQSDGSVATRGGEDFWKVGSVASGFSGDAGRRRLGLLIQALLPRPSDEITL